MVFALMITVAPFLYEMLLFYPPMTSDPVDNFLKLFFILLNQRITVETKPPTMPYDKMPVYTGNSLDVLDFEFVSSLSECGSDVLCIIVKNGKIKQADWDGLNFTRFEKTIRFDEAIQRLRKREFITSQGYPMSSLGRVAIYKVELKYYDRSAFYPWEKNFYVPVWVIHAKTSNYGEEVIFVEAVEVELSYKVTPLPTPEWQLMNERVFFLENGKRELIAGENSSLTNFLLKTLHRINLQIPCGFDVQEIEWIRNEEEGVEWLMNKNKILELNFRFPRNIAITPNDESISSETLENVRVALFVLEDNLGYGLESKILIGQEIKGDLSYSCWAIGKEDGEGININKTWIDSANRLIENLSS
jgi:hypothetical protein